MRGKISDIMNYSEFLERYLVNQEEFIFYYKDIEINICYGINGTFSYNITKNRVLILKEDFNSPNELLEKIKIDGIEFPKLWNYLE
ncbi:MAG: hypothetical protein IJX55_06795 [Clostridia bacterium]|nr:hypothetical protein [Clostridia bacterium]